MRGAERHLFGLGKKVIRIAIEHHATHGLYRNEFLRNQLGGVQDVETEFLGVGFGKDLKAEFPLRIVARFNCLPQISALKIRVRTHDLDGFVPNQGVSAE
jgi:hypothetical protein